MPDPVERDLRRRLSAFSSQLPHLLCNLPAPLVRSEAAHVFSIEPSRFSFAVRLSVAASVLAGQRAVVEW